jgi:hypothetical protein
VTAVVRGDLANNHTGATYEFVRTGTTWAQTAKFTAPGPQVRPSARSTHRLARCAGQILEGQSP